MVWGGKEEEIDIALLPPFFFFFFKDGMAMFISMIPILHQWRFWDLVLLGVLTVS